MKYYFAIVVACLAIVVTSYAAPQTVDDRPQPPASEDEITRRDFMRTKLMYSQNILQGLTTDNFTLVKESVAEIQRVTEGAQWVTIDSDEYRKLTEEFKSATQRLQQAADSGNIDATALRYYQMSTSCIDCHKHLRKQKHAF